MQHYEGLKFLLVDDPNPLVNANYVKVEGILKLNTHVLIMQDIRVVISDVIMV